MAADDLREHCERGSTWDAPVHVTQRDSNHWLDTLVARYAWLELLAGWPAGRLAGWPAGWLAGWLAGCVPCAVRPRAVAAGAPASGRRATAHVQQHPEPPPRL